MRWWLGLCLGAVLLGLTSVQAADASSEVAYDLDWHPDGSVLAIAASEHIWFLESGSDVVTTLSYPTLPDSTLNTPNQIEWSPDGKWLATTHDNGALRVWSYPERQVVIDSILTEYRYSADTIRWHPTQPLVSTYWQLVNVETGELAKPFTYDVYWGRSTNDPPIKQEVTGEVY
jgi:WD40 repeat protein